MRKTTDTSFEAVEPKCDAGCVNYHGGEIRHQPTCPFYPASFSELYNTTAAERDRYKARAERAEAKLSVFADDRNWFDVCEDSQTYAAWRGPTDTPEIFAQIDAEPEFGGE